MPDTLTPDAVLRTRANTTTRAMVDRIVRTYTRATPAQRAAGATWYVAGNAFVLALAAQHSLTPERVAAVVAHLSPRTSWKRNMTATEQFLADPTTVPAAILRRNYEAAVRALTDPDPLGTLNGPKVKRFARNLLGDRSQVTIDVWAMRVARGHQADNDRVISRAGVYAATERAYRLAAERIGVDPVTVQATTWIVARNGRAA